jgi:hypothetical protein
MPLGAATPGGAEPLRAAPGRESAVATAAGLLELHPETVRAMAIPIYATLGTATLTGYDTYRVPTTHDFLIEKILPHLVLMDLASEAAAAVTANITLAGFADRMAMKAANCLLDLKNTDREQKLFDNHSLSLASLFRLTGGGPIDFGPTPQKVLAGETIRLDVRFANTAVANQIAGNAQYGVLLLGKLIRVAKS